MNGDKQIKNILNEIKGQDTETLANFDEWQDYSKEEKFKTIRGEKIA